MIRKKGLSKEKELGKTKELGEENELGREQIPKLLLKFSIPAIVGMLVSSLYNIIDRIYLGHIPGVGNLAITGVGITMPISSIIAGFGMLVGIGAGTTISLKLGQGKKQEAEKILGNAFTLIIIISICITVLGLIFGKHILGMFGASHNTIGYAQDFMQIIFMGTIFNLIGFGLNQSIRASGSPLISMISMLIGAIANTILAPIFIFVLGLGVKGAATATVISQFLSAVWAVSYFLRKKSSLRVKAKNLKLEKTFVSQIFAIGISPFSMQVATSVVQVVANTSLKTYGGDLAIGAMTIVTSISTLILMPIFGLNQGMQPIVGYNFGAKKYARVKEALKYPQIAAITIAIVGTLLVELIPGPIVRFFNSDPELLAIAKYGMRIYLFMMIPVAAQIIRSNYFSCIGKAKISMVLSLLRQVLLLIPSILILPRLTIPVIGTLGLTGIWLAGPVSDIISVMITFMVFNKEMKKLDAMKLEQNELEESVA